MGQDSQVKPLHDPAKLESVLSRVLDQVASNTSGVKYRLVGTSAAPAQGVQLPVGDVDILAARRDDVDRFASALFGFPCLAPPAWVPDARQYFARFQVEEVDVEISTVEQPVNTDTFECIGRGPWEHYVLVSIGKHVVPVVRLELRLITELVRDRPDRYTPLTEHMRRRGADLQPVLKAMHDRKVDPMVQERILA